MIKRPLIFIALFSIVLLASSTPMGLNRYSVADFTTRTMSGEGNIFSRLFWILLIGLSFLLFLKKPSKATFASPLFASLSAYIVIVLGSSLLSKDASYSLVRVTSLIAYLVSAPVAATLVRNVRDLIVQQRLIIAILLLSILFSIALAIFAPAYAISSHENRFVGIFSYPNMAARIAVAVLIYLWVLPRAWLKPRNRLFVWIMTPLMLAIVFSTESRSTIIGVVAAGLFYFWIKNPRFRWAIVLGSPVVLFVFVVLAPVLYSLFLDFMGAFPHSSVLSTEEELFTLTGRTRLWEIIFENFKISVLGIGYKTLFYSTNGAIISSYGLTIYGGAHNAYIEPLIETGVLGSAALAVFVLSVLYKCYKIWQTNDAEIKQFGLFILTFAVFIFSQSYLEGLFDNANIFYWLLIYFGFLYQRMKHLRMLPAPTHPAPQLNFEQAA